MLLDASHRTLLANPRAEIDLLRLGVTVTDGAEIHVIGDTTVDALLELGSEEWHEVTVGTPQTGVFELSARALGEGETEGSVLLVIRDVTRSAACRSSCITMVGWRQWASWPPGSLTT